MILSLSISNYALIDQIEIHPAPGFNIITGETGAGKSIMLGALSLLLGGRADLKAVRDTSRKSVIEAVFDVSRLQDFNRLVEEAGADTDSERCIVRRELLPGGRSRAFINDTPVNLTQLASISLNLLDIHSQHNNMLLADTSYQLSVIDRLADNTALLEEYGAAYASYRSLLKAFTDTRDMIRRASADSDFMQFQYDELREMDLQPGEQPRLEQEQQMLANMTRIKEHLTAALALLSDGDNDVDSSLRSASSQCGALSDVLDDADSLAERLETARIEIRDVTSTLQDYDRRLGADPSRLEEVEARLNRLYSLELKHHVETSDDLIGLRDSLAERIAAISGGDDTLHRLEARAREAKRKALEIARQLSDKRRKVASELATELKNRSLPLGMNNMTCDISFTTGKLTPTGTDNVQLLVSFNKNQPLMPIGGNASGGEVSRLVLALKSIIAQSVEMPTIIFDEVDTGVSGDVANRMGEMMAAIAEDIQLISITHLPQVAARGTAHFKVYKEDSDTATNTRVKQLDQSEREAEIALMLSGDASDQTALAAARRLLDRGETSTIKH